MTPSAKIFRTGGAFYAYVEPFQEHKGIIFYGARMLPEEPMPASALTAGCALLGPEGLPSAGQTGIIYKEKNGKHLKSSIARRRDRMIRELNAHQMIELYGAVLPMAVLLVRDDD